MTEPVDCLPGQSVKPPGWYDAWYRSSEPAKVNWHREERVQRLYRTVNSMLDIDETVLDIGCGRGDILDVLSSAVRYFGIDWSREAIMQAIGIHDRGSFHAWNVNGASFTRFVRELAPTTSLAIQTFEHMPDDVGLAKMLLTYSGRVLFSVPHNQKTFDDTGHLRRYTEESVRERFDFGDPRFLLTGPDLLVELTL